MTALTIYLMACYFIILIAMVRTLHRQAVWNSDWRMYRQFGYEQAKAMVKHNHVAREQSFVSERLYWTTRL